MATDKITYLIEIINGSVGDIKTSKHKFSEKNDSPFMYQGKKTFARIKAKNEEEAKIKINELMKMATN